MQSQKLFVVDTAGNEHCLTEICTQFKISRASSGETTEQMNLNKNGRPRFCVIGAGSQMVSV